jgi:hypothetical protein
LAQDIPESPEETKSVKSHMKGNISDEDSIRDISPVIGNSQHLADENKRLSPFFPWIIPPPEGREASGLFPRSSKTADSHLIQIPWGNPSETWVCRIAQCIGYNPEMKRTRFRELVIQRE